MAYWIEGSANLSGVARIRMERFHISTLWIGLKILSRIECAVYVCWLDMGTACSCELYASFAVAAPGLNSFVYAPVDS